MTYKEFKNWCNERATDGCWGLQEAIFCLKVINDIDAHYFWKREKVWKQEYEILTYMLVIEPINDILESRE